MIHNTPITTTVESEPSTQPSVIILANPLTLLQVPVRVIVTYLFISPPGSTLSGVAAQRSPDG